MNNETKHTPGPWIAEYTQAHMTVTYSDGELRSHIAKLYPTGLCDEHGSIEANARLIAAAPDMLEALKQLAQCNLNEHNCASLDVANKRIRNIARAAIAKAQGQEKP